MVSLFQKMKIEVGSDLLHFASVRFLLGKKSRQQREQINHGRSKGPDAQAAFQMCPAVSLDVKSINLTTKLYANKSLRPICILSWLVSTVGLLATSRAQCFKTSIFYVIKGIFEQMFAKSTEVGIPWRCERHPTDNPYTDG